MHSAITAVRTAAILIYLLVAGGLLALTGVPGNPDPTATALYGVLLGISVAWLGSAGWAKKERWTIRLQATAIGLSIIGLAHTTGGADVAIAALVLMMFATTFLWVCHFLAQVLHAVQGSLVTINGFARTEATRQILYFGSFAVPISLTFAPGPIGIGFVAISGLLVGYLVTARARRRLTNGLTREAA